MWRQCLRIVDKKVSYKIFTKQEFFVILPYFDQQHKVPLIDSYQKQAINNQLLSGNTNSILDIENYHDNFIS